MECATSHFLETTFSNNNIKYKTINSHIQSFDWKVRDLEPVRKEKKHYSESIIYMATCRVGK